MRQNTSQTDESIDDPLPLNMDTALKLNAFYIPKVCRMRTKEGFVYFTLACPGLGGPIHFEGWRYNLESGGITPPSHKNLYTGAWEPYIKFSQPMRQMIRHLVVERLLKSDHVQDSNGAVSSTSNEVKVDSEPETSTLDITKLKAEIRHTFEKYQHDARSKIAKEPQSAARDWKLRFVDEKNAEYDAKMAEERRKNTS